MPQLRTKQELANLARAFAVSYDIVEYAGTLYMPVDFLTREPLPTTPETTVWIPLNPDRFRGISNLLLSILFANETEERSFRFMVKQFSKREKKVTKLLVRVREDYVAVLDDEGKLSRATGEFIPNYLDIPYDEGNTDLAAELFEIIKEWVAGEENARSLLYHLATSLQPSWSAVKYLLLIGVGRNGKSTLLKMIERLYGEDNISNITRQMMSARSALTADLNGKLLNVIFDGPKEALKDSSSEKTLIAGEKLIIELKYENAPFRVQTNALFIEGLQHEPKVSDKSPALQKRLARFAFPNVYPLDLTFEEKMLQPKMIAAFFQLLLDHWVLKSEVATKLQLTASSLDMQLSAVWAMSPLLRFLEGIAPKDPGFLQNLVAQKIMVDTFLTSFRAWLESNGYRALEDDYLLQQLKENFVLDRKTFRIDGRATSRRYIKGVNPDTMNAINLLLQGQSLEHIGEEASLLAEDL